MTASEEPPAGVGGVKIGVLSLQGAFAEHQSLLESILPPGRVSSARQVRTPAELSGLDGLVLPGGESTAMGLIGDATPGMWDALREFVGSGQPVWGTCAGLILLAERCVGTSAVISEGQALIGGCDVLVCRNYFGSQISSFELSTPPPPGDESGIDYPGVFIRAPAILSAGPNVEVLARVVATPCRQAAVVLRELENKIEAGESVVMMEVVDALDRKDGRLDYVEVKRDSGTGVAKEEKKDAEGGGQPKFVLPGAADITNAREVICVIRQGNILCSAFHPELTGDARWHNFFVAMVEENAAERRRRTQVGTPSSSS